MEIFKKIISFTFLSFIISCTDIDLTAANTPKVIPVSKITSWDFYKSNAILKLNLYMDTSKATPPYSINISSRKENSNIIISCQAVTLKESSADAGPLGEINIENISEGIYQIIDESSGQTLLTIDTSKEMSGPL